jgi:hypothetical protein
VEDNFERGEGPPRTVMPGGGGEEEEKKVSNATYRWICNW